MALASQDEEPACPEGRKKGKKRALEGASGSALLEERHSEMQERMYKHQRMFLRSEKLDRLMVHRSQDHDSIIQSVESDDPLVKRRQDAIARIESRLYDILDEEDSDGSEEEELE